MTLLHHVLSVLQDRSGFPILVSGVPPDAFSETGQLWDRLKLIGQKLLQPSVFFIFLD